jgi:hypothetical protein
VCFFGRTLHNAKHFRTSELRGCRPLRVPAKNDTQDADSSSEAENLHALLKEYQSSFNHAWWRRWLKGAAFCLALLFGLTTVQARKVTAEELRYDTAVNNLFKAKVPLASLVTIEEDLCWKLAKAMAFVHRAPSQLQETHVSTSSDSTMYSTFKAAQRGARDTGIAFARAEAVDALENGSLTDHKEQLKAVLRHELKQDDDLKQALEKQGGSELRRGFSCMCLLQILCLV